MGSNIYYYIVAAIIIGGILLPQTGRRKKYYIILMAAIHTFVCGFRYEYLTGDLQKYGWNYINGMDGGWFSESIWDGGRNAGFNWSMKFFSQLTDGNFVAFLFVIALIIEVAVALIIYYHSPMPWVSYLIWDCVGFYVFGFSAIKQALAMAFILLAFKAILDERPGKFIIYVLIAGFIHNPAFICAPAYIIARRKLSGLTVIGFSLFTIVVYIFRNRIVAFVSDFYYEETDFHGEGVVGFRFFMILILLIAGILLRRYQNEKFSKVFYLVAIAGVIQIFSSYDNVFTRLADYYLQVLILYIPMLLYDYSDNRIKNKGYERSIHFTRNSISMIMILVTVFSIWFYRYSSINITLQEVDDYTNYKFYWQVDRSSE